MPIVFFALVMPPTLTAPAMIFQANRHSSPHLQMGDLGQPDTLPHNRTDSLDLGTRKVLNMLRAVR